MRTFSSEGIILKRVDFGEADRLVTIFTKNKGKITSLAKGIRRIESRRAGNVELLNRSKLFFATSKSLPILTEAESVETYPNLKKDLKRVGLAYYLVELVDQFFHDQQESYKTYDLLSDALGFLDEVDLERARNVVLAFELQLLSLVGYGPRLYACTKCQKRIKTQGNILSPDNGGIVDKSCTDGSFLVKSISAEEIKLMRFASEKPLSETIKIKISTNLSEKLKEQMKFYLEYILEKELTSADFSERVNRLE